MYCIEVFWPAGVAFDRIPSHPWMARTFSQDAVDVLLKTLRTGYAVLDVTTGDIVAQQSAKDLFIPASVAKIPSLIAIATHVPGASRPQTCLVRTGPVRDGVIEDLVLVGDSDPHV